MYTRILIMQYYLGFGYNKKDLFQKPMITQAGHSYEDFYIRDHF